MDEERVMVLDVGTTGIKVVIFNNRLEMVEKKYRKVEAVIPNKDWFEQDPKKMLEIVRELILEVDTRGIGKMGITNQRETVVAWDKLNGEPIYNAVVWQDERTRQRCIDLDVYKKEVKEKTGLGLGPYFSASKMEWILNNVSGAHEMMKSGRLGMGTIDSWMLFNLCEGGVFVTDYTNASRTMVFDISRLRWDERLLGVFGIEESILPVAMDSFTEFGLLRKELVGHKVVVNAVCGDQQASMYAVGTERGATKITYGTGTFVMQMLGEKMEQYSDWFSTLVPSEDGPRYAIEAKVGAHGEMVERVLGDETALKEAFEKVIQETNEVLQKLPHRPEEIVVDGGFVQNEWFVKRQEQVYGVKVRQQKVYDGTAMGVAKMLVVK